MEKLPMSAGDANMWYRNCTIQAIVDGEPRAVVVSVFRHDLKVIGRALMGWNKRDEEPHFKEVTLRPADYELTMPRAGYFVDAEGDLIYIELRALKTIRRAMLNDRITVLKCYKDEGAGRGKRSYLAMDAMMTGRVDERIKSPTLAIDNGVVHYRGVSVGKITKKGLTLSPKYQYLEEYINHVNV